MADSNQVAVLARVIADGVRNDAHSNVHSYRLSLSLLPDLRKENNGQQITLNDWPVKLAGKKFKLYAAIDPDAANPGPSGTSSTIVEIKEWFLRGATHAGPEHGNPQAYEFDLNRAKKADTLWKRLFLADCGGAEQFSKLVKTLSPTASAEVFNLNVSNEPRFVTYPVATLAKGVTGLYGAHFAASTLAAARQLPMYDENSKVDWNTTTAIVSPRFFESINTDMFGVYEPDTVTRRVAMDAGAIKPDTGSTHAVLINYIRDELQKDVVGKNSAANYISAGFTTPLRNYLKAEADDNARLARRWTAFHDFRDPAAVDLQKAKVDASFDAYFEAMASYLAPWCRGELPGSGSKGPSFLSAEQGVLSTASSALRRSVAGYHAAWRPYSGSITRLKDDDAGPDSDIARKKFLSILARPGLAKFLGFTIDVEVRAGVFGKALNDLGLDGTLNSYFYLMADFGADEGGNNGAIDNPPARVWTTAIVQREDASGTKVRFFGPGNKKSFIAAKRIGFTASGMSGVSADTYDRGILDLAAPGEDGGPRYEIIDFDLDAALQALENSSLDRATASQKGAMDDSIPTALPNLQTRGLALIDRDRKSELAKEAQGSNAAVALSASKAQVLYAEDLVIGYRLDVGICKANVLERPEENRWRSLHNRTVGYDAHDIPGTYLPWLQADRLREDGFAKPVTRQAEAKGSSGIAPQFIAQETLAVWTGTSLAVRTERGPGKNDSDDALVDEIDSYSELGTNITFSLPTEAARRLPPLRFRRGHWMGARLVYANGGSLPLDAAVRDHYLAASTTAVGADGQGFVFRRGERIPAPAVLLPADDVLIAQPASTHGEGVSTAVVRGNGVTRRYLVPRNVNFEMAEAHGEFDKQAPRSAFTGYVRSQKDGSFPAAVKQAPPVAKQDPKTKKRNNPGNVLTTGNSSKAAPYFPDPMARECLILPLQHGLEESQANESTDVHVVGFYRQKNMTTDHARPIAIEVSAFEPKPADKPFSVRLINDDEMPRFSVKLAKAQDLDLVLWAEPDDDEQLVGMRALVAGWSYVRRVAARYGVRFDSLKTSPSPKLRAFGELLSNWVPVKAGDVPPAKGGSDKILKLLRAIHLAPHRTVSDHKRIRVVRPVMAPLAAPYVYPSKFKAVRIEITPAPTPDSPAAPIQKPNGWPEYVAIHANGAPLDFPSEDNGNTAFFVGTAEVHRPSTAKLRFQATWNEYDDNDTNVREFGQGDSRRFEYRSVPDRGEFAFEFARGRDPDKSAVELTDIDLLDDETGKLRGLKIDFKNTKARQVRVGVYGVSRFTDFYRAPKEPDHANQFERHDAERDFSCWVDSTKRPEKPEIDRIMPVFAGVISECRHGHRREITYQRQVSLRIFLKRGWYSSGEGELLGVICWPSNIFNGGIVKDDMAKCTLLDRTAPKVINPKEEFLTRWGADPVRESGDLDELIPSGAFKSAAALRGPLKLPLQPPDKEAPGGTPTFEIDQGCPNDPPASSQLSPSDSVDVAIAGYKPIIDPQYGQLWYCDLAIDPQASYFPFVRLGLARYQQHSKAGLELSYPVAEWAQIPPRRTVRVELLSNHDVLVVVQGNGYHRTNTDEAPADQVETLNHSAFRIRICRSSNPGDFPEPDGTSWLPVITEGHLLDCRVTAESTHPSDPILVCRSFKLPHSWQSRSYAVIVEEFEPMVADGSVYSEHVVLDRGPMFACTIPIAIHHPAPCKADDDDRGSRLHLLGDLEDA
jgi:hypothetical protein